MTKEMRAGILASVKTRVSQTKGLTKAETKKVAELLQRYEEELSWSKDIQNAALERHEVLAFEAASAAKELNQEREARRALASRPLRTRLPDSRESVTREFKVPFGDETLEIYVTTGLYPDGKPGEMFIRADKAGSMARGAFDAVALAVSIGLQYGVPLEAFTAKLSGMRFEPAGLTGDREFPMCSSVLDLVAKWLRVRFEEPK
jgi:ribonucleoside-diphosphate reductase alpha chain